jgi:hypothetical protein
VANRVKSKDVSIEYSPTDEMDADFFTKPLQGSLFGKFWNIIMNVKEASDLTLEGQGKLTGVC